MTFTTHDLKKITEQAEDLAGKGAYDEAMCVVQQKVSSLDQNLVTGKNVEELRQIGNRYERMATQGKGRPLPYAD